MVINGEGSAVVGPSCCFTRFCPFFYKIQIKAGIQIKLLLKREFFSILKILIKADNLATFL